MLALLRPNWQAARYAQKNNHHHNRKRRQQRASAEMHTVVPFCRELITWTRRRTMARFNSSNVGLQTSSVQKQNIGECLLI
jgi:hypothetical protein